MGVIALDPGAMKAVASDMRRLESQQDLIALRLIGKGLSNAFMPPRALAHTVGEMTGIGKGLQRLGGDLKDVAFDLETRAAKMLGEPPPETFEGMLKRRFIEEPFQATKDLITDPSFQNLKDFYNTTARLPFGPAWNLDLLIGFGKGAWNLLGGAWQLTRLFDRYVPIRRPWETPQQYFDRVQDARQRWADLADSVQQHWNNRQEYWRRAQDLWGRGVDVLRWIRDNPNEAAFLALHIGEQRLRDVAFAAFSVDHPGQAAGELAFDAVLAYFTGGAWVAVRGGQYGYKGWRAYRKLKRIWEKIDHNKAEARKHQDLGRARRSEAEAAEQRAVDAQRTGDVDAHRQALLDRKAALEALRREQLQMIWHSARASQLSYKFVISAERQLANLLEKQVVIGVTKELTDQIQAAREEVERATSAWQDAKAAYDSYVAEREQTERELEQLRAQIPNP
jgi:hypothetical protein